MWVKIKSDKIPDTVLTVPYPAFLNSYKKKGFYIIDENAKNKSKPKEIENEQSNIKLDDDEIEALKEIKETVEPVVENKVEQVVEVQEITDEEIQEHFKEKEQLTLTDEEKPRALNNRAPIKKAPISKR